MTRLSKSSITKVVLERQVGPIAIRVERIEGGKMRIIPVNPLEAPQSSVTGQIEYVNGVPIYYSRAGDEQPALSNIASFNERDYLRNKAIQANTERQEDIFH